jgi:hypothetical protein
MSWKFGNVSSRKSGVERSSQRQICKKCPHYKDEEYCKKFCKKKGNNEDEEMIHIGGIH